MHGDIKPDNIMTGNYIPSSWKAKHGNNFLNADLTVKDVINIHALDSPHPLSTVFIGDMGLAVPLPQHGDGLRPEERGMRGTVPFMSIAAHNRQGKK